MKPVKSILITDLDNTLYDWFGHWYPSFTNFLYQLSEESGIDVDTLKRDIKTVHQRHGTSECFYFIDEIQCLRDAFPHDNLRTKFRGVIETYRTTRDQHLELYPTVLETLSLLKKRGCIIVGYTDSQAMHSIYRTQFLNLDGVFDHLFTPPTHELDLSDPDLADSVSEYDFSLKQTKHHILEKGEEKPNVDVLRKILDAMDAATNECVYIGDNLFKDVRMAQDAYVTDVHAAYGTAHTSQEYRLLIDVTHWTDADVKREQELKNHHVNPTVSVSHLFCEILEHFHFVGRSEMSHEISDETVANQINIYKSIVDVQKHLNDIEIRIRALGFSFLGVLAGAVGVALRIEPNSSIGYTGVELARLFLLAALVIWCGVWFMDRHWYHRLLYGSVYEGLEMEKWLRRVGLRAALTDKIGEFSPIRILDWKLRSPAKIDLFYLIPGAMIAISLGALTHGTIMILFILVSAILLVAILRTSYSPIENTEK